MNWNGRKRACSAVAAGWIAVASWYVLDLTPGASPASEQSVPRLSPAVRRVQATEPKVAGPTETAQPAEEPRKVAVLFEGGQPIVPREVQLCQFMNPHPRSHQELASHPEQGYALRTALRPAEPFETYAQGEYIGPARAPHVPVYTLRVNDQLEFVYQFTHEETTQEYRLLVGDEIMVETLPQEADSIRRGDLTAGRGLQIQSDGTIYLPYIGRLIVSGKTINEVRQEIEERLTAPPTGRLRPGTVEVLITPIKTNTALEDLRSAVDARFGSGGQTRTATVTPEGTVQLVGVGSVPAQGLTISEFEAEINARYIDRFGSGIEVSAILQQYAPRYIWIAGEVAAPGQYQINQPLTVVQAIALARGFNVGGNVREVFVFRRNDNWQLMATSVNVRGVFVGANSPPCNDIWLRDNDLVVVPKGPILRFDEYVNLIFTRGVFACFPLSGSTAVTF